MNYATKSIQFNRQQVQIVCQNENGPCPLLALCNALILRGDMRLSARSMDVDHRVSADTLTAMLADYWLARDDKDDQGSEVLEMLPELREGLVVEDVGFLDPLSFPTAQDDADTSQEASSEDPKPAAPSASKDAPVVVHKKSLAANDLCAQFKLQLCHGWMLDQDDVVAFSRICACTNGHPSLMTLQNVIVSGQEVEQRLVFVSDTDKFTEESTRKDGESVLDGQACDLFLKQTASQLTYAGLQRMGEVMQHEQISIMFRNNHFHTLYKKSTDEGGYMLLTLVTDVGYLQRADVVWETLGNIDGDSIYLDSNFRECSQSDTVVQAVQPTVITEDKTPSQQQQEDADYQLAMRLSNSALSPTTNVEPEEQQEPHSRQSSRRSSKFEDKCCVQ